MATSKHSDKLNAFFKAFEISELWDIHLLKKAKIEWKSLSNPPSTINEESKKLFYHSPINNKDFLIIITSKEGIDRFDISNNTISHIADYPNNFKCSGSETIINAKNGDLYFIGGYSKCFGIYNLEQNEWSMLCLNDFDEYEKANKYNLSSVDNEPKIMSNTLFIKGWDLNRWYDPKMDVFVDVSMENSICPSSSNETKIVYNEYLDKYIQFGNDSSMSWSKSLSNEIWIFEQPQNSTECLWILSDFSLPSVYKQMSLKKVLCFEHFVILIYFSKKDVGGGLTKEHEIWCCDVSDFVWFKAKANFGDDFGEGDVEENACFITQDAVIHNIRFCGDESTHFVCNLRDILNDELYSKQAVKNGDLINGFLKDLCKEDDTAYLKEIASIILLYFSIFR